MRNAKVKRPKADLCKTQGFLRHFFERHSSKWVHEAFEKTNLILAYEKINFSITLLPLTLQNEPKYKISLISDRLVWRGRKPVVAFFLHYQTNNLTGSSVCTLYHSPKSLWISKKHSLFSKNKQEEVSPLWTALFHYKKLRKQKM